MSTDLPPELRAALEAEPDGESLAEVWDRLGEVPVPTATDDEWAALRARLPPSRTAGRRTAPDRAPSRTRRRWGAVVVAGVAALAAGLFVPVGHLAPAGGVLEVALPDGSLAVLNGGTELRYRRGFWSGRDLALEGEAFFEVEPGPPFAVSTHNARVEVLGTAFNVRAWPADGSTDVAVAHGRVRVEGAQSRSAVLGAHHVAVVGSDVAVAEGDAGRRAAWRSGGVSFEDRPLGSVLDEVERRYGVALEAAPDAPLGVRVTAFYARRPGLDTLLGDLGAAAGVRFTPTADGYRVRASRPAPAPPPPPTARP